MPIFDFAQNKSVDKKPKIKQQKMSDLRSSSRASREKISYWIPPSDLDNAGTGSIININAYHLPENIDLEKQNFI